MQHLSEAGAFRREDFRPRIFGLLPALFPNLLVHGVVI